MTAKELLVEQGLGAAQAMYYMGQLNQFIAKALLPGPGPTQRHPQVLKATAALHASAHPSMQAQHTHAPSHASASTETELLATMQEVRQAVQGRQAVRRVLLQDDSETEDQQPGDQQPGDQQPGDQQPDLPPSDSGEI